MRIMLAEDDPFTGELLAGRLAQTDWSVTWLQDGAAAFNSHLENNYDLLLLDWMLPGLDGVKICKLLRQRGDAVPIIMLSARDRTEDCVTGLKGGADDYMMKPFFWDELLARIRGLIRRSRPVVAGPAQYGGIEYHSDKRAVAGDGQMVYLSKKEAALFELLLRQGGRPVARERLAAAIWKDRPVSGHMVDPLISRLRKRLAPLRLPCTISNERGMGFILHLDR